MSMSLPSTVPDVSPGPSAGLPPMAWKLGHAGLIPFVLGAVLVWLVTPDAHPYAASALSAYGAVIVSFLGGIHWGLAMRMPGPAQGAATAPAQTPLEAQNGALGTSTLVWGITPSLLAWVGVLMPPHAGLFILGLAIIGCYLVDRRRYPLHGVQAWLTLRFRLTAVASLCCFLGAAGS